MIKSLVLAFSCSLPLAMFTVLGFNLDRLLIICIFSASVLTILLKGDFSHIKKSTTNIIIFIFIWYIFLLSHYCYSFLYEPKFIDLDRYLLAYIYMPLVFYFGYYLRNIDENFKKFEFVLICWLLIFLFFLIYSYYYYFILSTFYLPILNLFSIDSINHFQQARTFRVFLPFFSAPHLAAVTGFIFIYFYYFSLFKFRKVVSFVSFFIMLTTLSRGPFLTILMISFFIFFYQLLKMKINYKIVLYSLFGIFVVFYIGFEDFRIFEKFLTILEGRHFSLRFDAIQLITNFTIIEHLVGKGIGSFPFYIDGDYSFTSFLTVYFEMGLLGFLLFFVCFFSFYFNVIFKRSELNAKYFFLVLYVIFVNFFYELKTLLPLYFILGYFFINPTYKPKV